MRSLDIGKVVAAVRDVVGQEGVVALHEPQFSGNEKSYLTDCIESTFVSTVGVYVSKFEMMLQQVTGSKHAIACVNGTAALQVALQIAGVRSSDEVIMPALTFVATANSASFIGAVPHFVDSERKTLGIGSKALSERLAAIGERANGSVRNRETGARIAAIIPMHTFGHPVDVEGIESVAADWRIPVVEDATEALGSLYHNRHVGTFGLLSALSFNGNKIITTGGGGAILTDDDELAARAKHLTTTAKAPHRWAFIHDEVGYNFRLPNINAALGCAQLEQLDRFIEQKRRLAERYRRAFETVAGVAVFVEQAGARSNYWLNTLIVEDPERRDELLAALNNDGLMARPVWTLMHRLPMYHDCPRGPLDVAEDLERRIVNLPSSAKFA